MRRIPSIGLTRQTRLVRGAAPAPHWTPLALTNLFAWFSAKQKVYSDAGTTPAVNDDPVRRWVSMNDVGIYVDQSTLGNRPVYVTDDGAPYVYFDGSNDFMASNVVASDIDATTGLTVWVSLWAGVLAADTSVISAWTGTASRMFNLGWDTGPKATWEIDDGDGLSKTSIRPGGIVLPDLATWNTMAGTFDNASNGMKLLLKNAELATGSYTNTPTGDEPFTFGRLLSGADRWFNGYLRDVVIVERQLTSDELLLLEGYAA